MEIKEVHMKHWMPALLAIAVILAVSKLQASPAKDRLITMNVPAPVVVQAIKRVLPLRVDGSSSGLEGVLTIVGITNFRVRDQQIKCRIEMTGTDMHIVTNVAGQQIRLKLGSARMAFDCDARIRFDTPRQILYIKPKAGDVRASEALAKGDIGQMVMLLVDGREFPVPMKNLKPVVAETADKIITVRTKIVDVKAVDGALELSLSPEVSTSPR